MRRALALGGAAMLAACSDGAPTPAASPTAAEASAVVANVATATPQRQIGVVSGLSAESSALTGITSGFAVERSATETRVALAADTLFDFDQATLTATAQDNLQRTAALVREGGAGTVTVTGYTDAKGEDGYNLALSRRRAEAVVAWLKGAGGAAQRPFAALGKGEADPVAPNTAPDGSDDPAGRARNRRVVVSIPR